MIPVAAMAHHATEQLRLTVGYYSSWNFHSLVLDILL
jgi:hypothetical protein